MQNKKTLIAIVAIVVLIGGISVFAATRPPHVLAAFAQCLGEKKVTFYGAFWCPHCQEQKKLFGRAAKDLPYIECSTPDGNGQKAECKEKGITNYPTWDFAIGDRISTVLTPETLAEKTGCVLPEGYVTEETK